MRPTCWADTGRHSPEPSRPRGDDFPVTHAVDELPGLRPGIGLTALTLLMRVGFLVQQLKTDSTDSLQPLLGVDPSSPTTRSIVGVPVYWSPYIDEGAVWGMPMAIVFVVVRQDVSRSWIPARTSPAIGWACARRYASASASHTKPQLSVSVSAAASRFCLPAAPPKAPLSSRR